MALQPNIDQSDDLSTAYKAPPAKDVLKTPTSPNMSDADLVSSAPSKTIEQWAEELKTDPAMFAVAKAITPGWGIGRECTKDTFTAALKNAANLTFR